MRQRSISDEEISIIKAMIARGMATKDIQFFFNRQDRPVNSGRISGIRSGTYSNSANIDEASTGALDNFLANFQPQAVRAQVGVPSASGYSSKSDPVSAAAIEALFSCQGDSWQLCHKESDRYECKESFGFRHSDKWMRAVAALANNKGGYVIFGVQERVDAGGAGRILEVVGLSDSEFDNADPVEFSRRLKSAFDPTPAVEAVTVNIGEKKVGVLYVHQHVSRPVIATKNEGTMIKEGDIYFRYPGQSARIKYSDLRALFDERDKHARASIMPMIQKLLSLGPENAMIADLASGTLADGRGSLTIGEDLLDRIKFIREGQFSEKDGAPALKLVGDVHAVDAEGHLIRKGFVTPSDLVNDFLEQQAPYEPKEYIRCAVEGGNGGWLPMHYFARKAGLGREGLIAYIMAMGAPQSRKELYAKRASGENSAFSAAGGQPAQIVEDLKRGQIPEISDIKVAANLGRAVAGLSQQPRAELSNLLNALKASADLVQASQKQSWLSPIRRGIARLDELYFGDGDWTKGAE